ncbi:RICIN domain-containing protein [Paenibacillus sp. FSL H7-0331]|uniref:RICIN domain-containing protein n=1 Tax=Paenibacillus sp. FSL H7-0331 TaxID=1920421 RepID=UPI0009F98A96|nr:RICIN domain-containing protein [Paenibacillus sp. FSL H7-0331]
MHNWDYRYKTAHKWNFVDVGNGLFKIINVNSGKALEVASGNTTNGAKVQQNDYTGAARQQWRIQPVGGGQYVNDNRF